jgi:Protein of unknown function (DUF1488)
MPLTPVNDDKINNSDVFTLSFPMMDGAKVILIRVTDEALQDRAARESDGSHLHDLDILFHRYRAEIEAVASRKYDEGHHDGNHVTVISEDLSPEEE